MDKKIKANKDSNQTRVPKNEGTKLSNNPPYLSIVATSRNDNHGGDLRKRMIIFVKGLLHQTRKYQLPAELIMVEWNPPTGKPLLHKVLPKPQQGDYLTIRYIVVPNELHRQYKRGDVMPLFQMIGKNVGIRRANSPFVLCTNVDIIFSDPIMEFLAKKQLNANCFYRANRADIPADLSENWTMDKVLQYCEKNVLYTLGLNPDYKDIAYAPTFFYKFAPPLKIWNKIIGAFRKRRSEVAFKMQELDTRACGDFTLMSKAAWLDIQGYPEFDLYSIHIDSMGIMAATALDYQQVILPPKKRVFHIHHKDGWEAFTPISVLKYMEKIPGLDWNLVADAGAYIVKHKSRYNINKPDWGFANEDLEEFVF